MEDYFGPVFPNYYVSENNAGQSLDFTNGGYDYGMPDTDYYSPSGLDYYSSMFPMTNAAVPASYSADYSSLFPTMSGYEMPVESFPQGTDAGGMPSFFDRALEKFSEMPLDRQIGLGMGVVGGLGQAMTMAQRNRLAKKAMKQNDKLNAFQNAQMERRIANNAIADRYNNSYDTTTPATVAYRPLTAEQARSYGETGAPFQQVEITPGETTRTYLAEGGLANYMCGGEVDSKGMPKYEDGGYAGCDIPEYAMGGEVNGSPMYANGGQADNIQAMLSEGEFVIPADVVSALGDGNTKAGASALHQMMKNVRKRARGGKLDKIPPPAKPAVKYMKKGK